MFAEIKTDGVWQKVGKEFVSTYPDMKELTDRVYDKHNRDLIRWLYYSRKHDGMPFDASEEIQNHRYFENKKMIFWFTLDELLSLDWDTEVYDSSGFISEWQYKQLKEKGTKPVNIRNKIYNREAEEVWPFEMDMILRYPKLRVAPSYYVVYNYNQKALRDKFDHFCNVYITRLIELIPDGCTAKDVRIIFGY